MIYSLFWAYLQKKKELQQESNDSKLQFVGLRYHRPLTQKFRQNVHTFFGEKYPRAEKWVLRNANKFSNSRIISPIPDYFGWCRTDFT